MRFFKLQILDDDNKINYVDEALADNRITSNIEYAREKFNHLLNGDLVLVHKGNAAHALVKVLYKITNQDEINGISFGTDYKVQILDLFTNVKDNERLAVGRNKIGFTGTFNELIDKDTPTYQFVRDWYNLINNQFMKDNIKKLLTRKKQIILQGPPGTGKTRLAKEIAKQVTIPDRISVEQICNTLKVGQNIMSVRQMRYTIKKIEDTQLVYLRQSTQKEGILKFQDIQNAFQYKIWLNNQINNGSDPYSAAFAKHIYENYYSKELQLIQFHPSYTYEDFVRGITVKSGEKGLEYITENKILAKIAKEAHQNYLDSQKEPAKVSKEKWIAKQFELFKDEIDDEIEVNNRYPLTDTIGIEQIGKLYFKYVGNGWHDYIKYSDFLRLFESDTFDRKEIKKLLNIGSRATYYNRLALKFKDFLANKPEPTSANEKIALKNYVLIIDEINRANLSSVLGELIYALEYRGEPVESMYEMEDGGNTIILPENLYIIGTMNTADRSVGQIDYAIRRRFAFVDVLPKVLDETTLDAGLKFNTEKFNAVAKLFVGDNNHLSEEFKSKDVQLGHSYFIYKDGEFDLNLKHEIKPILREYVADGILKESALSVIENL